MFKAGSTSGELNGFLDAGSHIQGDLLFEDTFRVDGRVTGRVRSKGDLVVGAGGSVEGDIEVGRLFVSGIVKGRVAATQRVEISAGGKVFAEINTSSLIIEDGALFDGQCSMSGSNGGAAGASGLAGTAAKAASSAQDAPPSPGPDSGERDAGS